MYFVTPPVGTGALIAARVSGGTYLRTGFEATKAAMGGFIVPFLFLLSPALLLHRQAWDSAIAGIISTLIILVALQAALCNQYIIKTSPVQRLMLVLIAPALMTFMAVQNYALFASATAVFALLSFLQMRTKKKALFESLKVEGPVAE
jgi:TRAP-type uncharacterized transport system fused permease subunit